jgi:hypothetical protein
LNTPLIVTPELLAALSQTMRSLAVADSPGFVAGCCACDAVWLQRKAPAGKRKGA